MQQTLLPIELHHIDYNKSKFIVSYCNLEAYNALHKDDVWPYNRLLLLGEHASGKTHLTSIWQEKNAAQIIDSNTIYPLGTAQHILCDDIDNMQEERLLTLLNIATEYNKKLLMTMTTYRTFTIKDLQSRMNATYKVLIKKPDESMIKALMQKILHDRQIHAKEAMIEYVATRIKRSFAYVNSFLNYLDTEALRKKRNISIPFVKEILEEFDMTREDIDE